MNNVIIELNLNVGHISTDCHQKPIMRNSKKREKNWTVGKYKVTKLRLGFSFASRKLKMQVFETEQRPKWSKTKAISDASRHSVENFS